MRSMFKSETAFISSYLPILLPLTVKKRPLEYTSTLSFLRLLPGIFPFAMICKPVPEIEISE